jgi:prepilin-type N-terminal cleavage/methylation domain-containing protein
VRRGRLSQGFNLVEIMITLTLVALLTTTLITFVNDFDDKTKVARARADMMRMGQQAVMAESQVGQQLSTASASGSQVMTMLLDWIVELPDFDPWGNRFMVSSDGTVVSSETQGAAYILDPSYGRMLCAGPDGVINTKLGASAADRDNDIVVEFRQQPWMVYSFTPNGSTDGKIWVARADGTAIEQVFPHSTYNGGVGGVQSVSFSPDGSRWVGVETDGGGTVTNRFVHGFSDPENPRVQKNPSDIAIIVNATPFFAPDGKQVLFVTGGGGLGLWNPPLGSQVTLLQDGSMTNPAQHYFPDWKGRIIHASRQRSYLWHPSYVAASPEQSQAVAVSSDGKVAVGWYMNVGRPGIYLLLPGGQSKRLLKPKGGDGTIWLPLFWVDNQNLIYYAFAGTNIAIRRISQDGRFDIPLYNATDTNFSFGGLPPTIPSISPDGRYLAFVHTADRKGKVIRTDGGGFLKGTRALSEFQVPYTPINSQEFLFSVDGGSLYGAQVHGGSSGIFQLNLDLGNPTGGITPSNPTFNLDFSTTPSRMAMNPNGTLIAVVSAPTSANGAIPGVAAPPEQGVFVFPLLGPTGAKVTVTTTEPVHSGAKRNLPNIAWIND